MIRYDDVVVRYPRAARDALAGVGLEARRGRLTAVVGPNGSGKSTLVRALLGRVPVSSGQVFVNGEPADAQSRTELARRVAVITQREESAFPLDVEEYVALGRFPHLGGWRGARLVDRDAVARAMERAGVGALARDRRRIHDLSGGEWQRLALARLMYRDADIWILDEPTSSLDPEAEAAIFAELKANLQGRIGIVISHRFSTVRIADRIAVIVGGKVTELGTHAELIAAGGRYAHLFEIQAAGYR